MNGAIAFLDILGYQSFLENNSAADSALKVLDLITTLPKEAHAELSKHWLEKKFDQKITKALDYVIFSDTVVLLLPYQGDDQETINASVAYLTTCAGYLVAKMFDAGLPMRGAIVEGDFIVKESCFAGRGIVDSYNLCAQLDFCGLVVSQEISNRLSTAKIADKTFIRKELYDPLFVPILSPLKIGKREQLDEKRFTHVNWIMFTAGPLKAHLESDLIQCVMSRFWAHNKDCPTSVDAKIRNTCKILRRLRMALPSTPEPSSLPKPK